MKKGIIYILLIICFGGLIYSSYKIITYNMYITENKNIKEELDKEIVIEDDKYYIDMNKLKEMNDDTVAYLNVNNTNISYVVVKSTNNDYYLHHNFNKKRNSGGWVFADYKNKFDDNDKNIVIYGHNMKDGSMFGTLRRCLSKNWQNNEENLDITLIVDNKEYIYSVFSTYTIDVEDYYIQTDFKNDEYYIKFLNNIKKRSNKKYDVDLDKDDRILTLSTCSGNGKRRTVVHSKLIKEEEIN